VAARAQERQLMAARIFIDIGDVNAVDPDPTAVWDAALWDDPAARWAGTMPNWTEISCRVRSVDIDRGRRGTLHIFEPGRATVAVANPDGWASWSPDAPGPVTVGAWLRIRADQEVLFTGSIHRVLDAYTPTGELNAELVCIDPLARLGQVELPPRPAVGGFETAAARIGRILDEVRLAPDLRDLDPGGPNLTPTTLAGSMADQAQQAAVTAGGHLFADRDGRICYRDAGWLRTDPRATTVQAVIANDGRPGALCATGIEANGPDLERLINLTTCSGIDDSQPDLDPLEVTQTDQASAGRYGTRSWSVDQLYTRDPAQLAVLGSRVLELRSQPRVWIEGLTISPIADPAASTFCATVDFGDRLEVAYRHPLGWGWETDVHVHGIGYRLRPSGELNECAEWTTDLTLDDATYWQAGEAWDYAEWDVGHWSSSARTLEDA